MRLNWQDEVLFPHEAASNNICYLNQAVQALEEGEIEEALKALYEVDNNCYAFLFDEALNNASRLKSNFIIVLNDNNMSISENVGGMSQYLNGLRTAQAYTGLKKGVEDTLKNIPGTNNCLIPLFVLFIW